MMKRQLLIIFASAIIVMAVILSIGTVGSGGSAGDPAAQPQTQTQTQQ